MTKGTAAITIDCPPDVVFNAVSDVSRMGDWSPECTGGRWIKPATGPGVGARFEGDNIAKLGPITLKKWTTVSEVTSCKPGEVFEFIVEGYTSWRYEFIEIDGSTRVAESFDHEPYEGFKKLLYGTLLKRDNAMVSGMEQTLERVKKVLENEQTSVG